MMFGGLLPQSHGRETTGVQMTLDSIQRQLNVA